MQFNMPCLTKVQQEYLGLAKGYVMLPLCKLHILLCLPGGTSAVISFIYISSSIDAKYIKSKYIEKGNYPKEAS